MSLLKIGLIVGVIVAGQFYWKNQSPEKRAQLTALLPFASKSKEPEKTVKSKSPAHAKTTVYQTRGKNGEVSFSDHYDGASSPRLRVVDNAKGTTFQTTSPSQGKQSATLSWGTSDDNARAHQQAQAIKHARMDRIIHGQ